MTWTLLHDAAVHQDTKHVIEIAHAHSEQALKVDDHGLNPLSVLVLGSNPSVTAVQALLDASPQAVSDQDVHGDTPLHLAACTNCSVDVVQMLLDACPTVVSMKNHEGLMPLHVACRYANRDSGALIALLVETYPYALLFPIKVCTETKWQKLCSPQRTALSNLACSCIIVFYMVDRKPRSTQAQRRKGGCHGAGASASRLGQPSGWNVVQNIDRLSLRGASADPRRSVPVAHGCRSGRFIGGH